MKNEKYIIFFIYYIAKKKKWVNKFQKLDLELKNNKKYKIKTCQDKGIYINKIVMNILLNYIISFFRKTIYNFYNKHPIDQMFDI